MGYTTDFSGAFKLSKPLTGDQRRYLVGFSDTRRMKRDAKKCVPMGDINRIAAGIMGVGEEGGYFTGGRGCGGQDHDVSVINHNEPPTGQPGLWCQWEPDATGEYLGWNGAEKFYRYEEWLKYIIDHFLTQWGITITGVVQWEGEDPSDRGSIVVTDSVVEMKPDEMLPTTNAERFLP